MTDLYEVAKQVTEETCGEGSWTDPRYPAPTWDAERSVWRVKTTSNWHVEIIPMMFNYRVVLTPVDNLHSWDHGWCYFGKSALVMAAAVLAAQAFDPETESAPAGYDKALTGRR